MGYCYVCQSAGSVNSYGFCEVCGSEHQTASVTEQVIAALAGKAGESQSSISATVQGGWR